MTEYTIHNTFARLEMGSAAARHQESDNYQPSTRPEQRVLLVEEFSFNTLAVCSAVKAHDDYGMIELYRAESRVPGLTPEHAKELMLMHLQHSEFYINVYDGDK